LEALDIILIETRIFKQYEYITELRDSETEEAPLRFVELVFGARDFMNLKKSIGTAEL
jgi:hypothetical protein